MEQSELILREGLTKLGIQKNSNIECDIEKLIHFLLEYIKEINMFNKAFNLVKVKDDKELIISHILDSLSAYKFFLDQVKLSANNEVEKIYIADVGSGAGFPGIPLACFFKSLNDKDEKLSNKIEFTLIERMKKRCNFLENVKVSLNLTNTKIFETELELAPKNYFDIITCRAFRTLDENILSALLNSKKNSGKFFLYKATEKKIYEDVATLKKQNINFKIENLEVPFLDHERNLLII